jgi:hypothetical protein
MLEMLEIRAWFFSMTVKILTNLGHDRKKIFSQGFKHPIIVASGQDQLTWNASR